MLYILLFFQLRLLQNERPVMREIVDKHFAGTAEGETLQSMDFAEQLKQKVRED